MKLLISLLGVGLIAMVATFGVRLASNFRKV
jgi:hypothetical protein